METAEIDEMYRLETQHWWYIGKRLLIDALLRDVPDRAALRILDVGCGTGAVLAHVGGRGHTVGVDRSVQALRYCRERGLARLACAEGGRLPFAAATFDVILLMDALEHFAEEGPLLEDVARILRPDGWLLISVPAFQFLWSEHDEVLHHFRRYTARTLRRALEASHFTVERLTYTNVVAFPPAVVLRGIVARLGISRRRGTDFSVQSPWINKALVAAYRLEAKALGRVRRFPFGLSVAALARPPVPNGAPRTSGATTDEG